MDNRFNIGYEPFSGINSPSYGNAFGNAQPTIGFGTNPRPGIAQPLPSKPDEDPSKEEEEPAKKKKKKQPYEITCGDR
jgi:hypothetical protein